MVFDFAKAKTKKTRGQMQLLGMMALSFVGLIAAGMILLVYMYTGSTLATSLNNANTTLAWNNITAGVVNFTGQLGTVGTIAGVALLLGVIGGIGILAYSGYQRARGGGTGM